MSDDNTVHADYRKLADLISNVRVALMHTFRNPGASAGAVHVRPMYTQKILPATFRGEMFFFSDAETDKVAELQGNPEVLLTYASPDKEQYVVIRGVATCEHNEAKATELWNIHAKGWWPEGPQSPRLTVIRVTVTGAEYWDGPGKLSYAVKLPSAVSQGKRIETYGEHGKL